MVYLVRQNPRVDSRSGVGYPQHCETGDAEFEIVVYNNSVGPSKLRIHHSNDSENFARVERPWPLMPCSRDLQLGFRYRDFGIFRAHSWEI
jgi:hypothetical protein